MLCVRQGPEPWPLPFSLMLFRVSASLLILSLDLGAPPALFTLICMLPAPTMPVLNVPLPSPGPHQALSHWKLLVSLPGCLPSEQLPALEPPSPLLLRALERTCVCSAAFLPGDLSGASAGCSPDVSLQPHWDFQPSAGQWTQSSTGDSPDFLLFGDPCASVPTLLSRQLPSHTQSTVRLWNPLWAVYFRAALVKVVGGDLAQNPLIAHGPQSSELPWSKWLAVTWHRIHRLVLVLTLGQSWSWAVLKHWRCLLGASVALLSTHLPGLSFPLLLGHLKCWGGPRLSLRGVSRFTHPLGELLQSPGLTPVSIWCLLTLHLQPNQEDSPSHFLQNLVAGEMPGCKLEGPF